MAKASVMISRLRRMDSSKFEARFSNKNRIPYGWIRSSDVSIDELKPFLKKLPPREQDLIQMYYGYNKNQKDIARMFGVTQGAISSRLSRAYTRLIFLRDLPKITDEEIDRDLRQFFTEIEVEIIKFMKETTCQSRTAQLVNTKLSITDDKQKMTQVKVRHRFEKCIHHLEIISRQRSEFKRYYDLLLILKKNLYKLHEVKLPHFDRGAHAVCSLND